MTLNSKVATLLLGLLIGGVAGYLTRPESAQIKIGGVSVEFSDNHVSSGSSDDLTSGQARHIMLYTLIGGVAGLLLGFVVDRRR
jgi:hypothetical protein